METATKAADSAKDTATSDETVAENKYDTFGLEASYLAHGQSQRSAEILQEIERYNVLPFPTINENTPICISAMVDLESDDVNRSSYFIGPVSGGLKFQWQGQTARVITPQTPLGKQLLGKCLDDIIELKLDARHCVYTIVGIC